MLHHSAFRAALTRCLGHVPPRILVALSGGVDSMCLTYLLTKYRDLYQPALHISSITIDHNFRQGSSDEAVAVGEIVSRWGVDHHIRKLDYDEDVSRISNFEEVAREKRYQVFLQMCKELNTNTLLVGHNLNDQVETYIQRVRCNSTLFGLVGLKAVSNIPILDEQTPEAEPVRVVRPLLEFTKSSLIEYCETHGVRWFEDSTNADINLTQRNMDRYLVNDYIPRHHSCENNIIGWNALVKSHSQVLDLAERVEKRAEDVRRLLEDEQRLELDQRNGAIKLCLNQNEVQDTLMLSRVLFKALYPVSSVKHYHWIYSKILNVLVPRIESAFNDTEGSKSRTTIANLQYDMHRTSNAVRIDVMRQPMITKDIPITSISTTVSATSCPWVFFDRRFWVKVHSQFPQDVMIVAYSAKTHRKELTIQFPGATIPRKEADGTPMVVDSNHNLSLFTYGLVHPQITVEWRLKQNVYRI